jgi:hypothetical protein
MNTTLHDVISSSRYVETGLKLNQGLLQITVCAKLQSSSHHHNISSWAVLLGLDLVEVQSNSIILMGCMVKGLSRQCGNDRINTLTLTI